MVSDLNYYKGLKGYAYGLRAYYVNGLMVKYYPLTASATFESEILGSVRRGTLNVHSKSIDLKENGDNNDNGR